MKISLKNMNNLKKIKSVLFLINKKFFLYLYLALFIFLIVMLYFLFNKKKTLERFSADAMSGIISDCVSSGGAGAIAGDNLFKHVKKQDN